MYLEKIEQIKHILALLFITIQKDP